MPTILARRRKRRPVFPCLWPLGSAEVFSDLTYTRRPKGLDTRELYSAVVTVVSFLTQLLDLSKGFAIGCALEFLAAICCLVLHLSYRMENARRDRLYGKPEKNARVDTHELADKAPDFRYMT
ncbi:hypothetical protein H0H93_015505 [Arthromyces matolae]|nr:hypothetical protein H0H93_015505 [Arthromyces matolae]